MWIGEILWALRSAIGDNSIIDASKLEYDRTADFLFWFTFLIVVFFSCVIFLNFIVAEASNSYNVVKEKIEQVIWQG